MKNYQYSAKNSSSREKCDFLGGFGQKTGRAGQIILKLSTLNDEHGKSHGYGGALITWVLPCMHGKYDGMAKLIQYDFCHAV